MRRWVFSSLVLLAITHALEETEEIPHGQALVDAYMKVFSVRGGARVVSVGPPVTYVENRLRAMLGIEPGVPLDLRKVRAVQQEELLVLLFKSVAGDYTAGKSALRSDVCRLISDPETGYINVIRDNEDDEPALIVISVVLLCFLLASIMRKDPAVAKLVDE